MSARVSSYDHAAPTPDVGSVWTWGTPQPPPTTMAMVALPSQRGERVTVTEVEWNGEEWWVRTRGPSGEFWTDLSVFWENARKPSA